MRRRSASAFARWERKRRVPKWRHISTRPPAPADLRLASWCPGNAPAAKTTEQRISKCGAGTLAREKHGVARNGGLYCLSQLKVAESRLHAGEGARATLGYFVSILRFIFTVGRVSN